MSICCGSDGNTQSGGSISICPNCGLKGKAVSTLTVKSIVMDHIRVTKNGVYLFCRTPDCNVVYFNSSSIFYKADTKVRVGLKEQVDPIPICYCFGYTRKDIRRDIRERGKSDIPEYIKAEVQAGFCACEVKNPTGSCCLGDITRIVRELNKDSSQSVAGLAPGLTRRSQKKS
jgi:hypothetical protein